MGQWMIRRSTRAPILYVDTLFQCLRVPSVAPVVPMAEKKKVRMIKPWGMHAKGATLELDTPIADLLIQSGRGELVQPESAPKKRPPVKLQEWVKKPGGE